jgi:hypothetical protein
MKSPWRGPIIAATVLMAMSCGCRQRLAPVLYRVDGGEEQRLDPVESYYLEGYSLTPLPTDYPFETGEGKVLVTIHRGIDPGLAGVKAGILTAPGELTYRIYIALPNQIAESTFEIEEKSYCRIVGMYERDDKFKNFVCREGYLRIDTLGASKFSAFLSGKYFNIINDSLVFEGFLKARRKKQPSLGLPDKRP